ncbi:Pisatin demethylase [Fusarium oxysporum f. sp. albedinis]|nr:Pisatin demethylase [Fusarium oxysporum f. sp. albedinis]
MLDENKQPSPRGRPRCIGAITLEAKLVILVESGEGPAKARYDLRFWGKGGHGCQMFQNSKTRLTRSHVNSGSSQSFRRL